MWLIFFFLGYFELEEIWLNGLGGKSSKYGGYFCCYCYFFYCFIDLIEFGCSFMLLVVIFVRKKKKEVGLMDYLYWIFFIENCG